MVPHAMSALSTHLLHYKRFSSCGDILRQQFGVFYCGFVTSKFASVAGSLVVAGMLEPSCIGNTVSRRHVSDI